MRLSIIVPIFNVETYLRKCVDSLLRQDVSSKEYEIILVDDGSPDNCPAICDEYAGKYDNIKVIHQDNGGLSVARNRGIEIAQGDYVQFVDSDDYLKPNVLKGLMEKMEKENLDVFRFNYQNVNERYEVFEPNKVSKPYVDYKDEVCDGLTFLNERLGFGCYACQFLVRRELLDNCRFKEGIFFEDTEWTPRMLLKAKRVSSTDLMVYNYLIRSGSITQSSEKRKKLKVQEDRMALIDSLKEQRAKVSDDRWFSGMIAHMVLTVLSDICNRPLKEIITIIKQLRAKGVFPLSNYHATKAVTRKIRLANVSPLFYCMMLYMTRRVHL